MPRSPSKRKAEKPRNPGQKSARPTNRRPVVTVRTIEKLKEKTTLIQQNIEALRKELQRILSQLDSDVGKLKKQNEELEDKLNGLIKDNNIRFGPLEELLKNEKLRRELEESRGDNWLTKKGTDSSSGSLRSVMDQVVDAATPYVRGARGSFGSKQGG